jgi:hypothetical protein
VQAAGLVAAPVFQGQQGQQGRVEIGEESVVLPSWEEAECAGAAAPGPERLASGGAVVGETVLSQQDLVAAAERLGQRIPELPEGRRHILVLSGFAGDPAERSLLSWATMAGAAVLLEPEPASYVPTSIWARPTVFAGAAADRLRLRETVERNRRRRLPFGRLRAVLGTEGELPEEEKAFWEERGVRAFAAERQERGI